MYKITFENNLFKAKGIRIINGDKNAELTMQGIRMGNFQDGIYSFQEQLQEAYRRDTAWAEALKKNNQARATPELTDAQLILMIISKASTRVPFGPSGSLEDDCWNVIPIHRVDGFYTTTPVVAEFF